MEKSATFSGYFLVAGTILYLIYGIDVLLGDLVDCQFIDSIDSVIVYLLVLYHTFFRFIVSKNNVTGVFLTSPAFNLDSKT
jgi:hypothetical protein